jgi:hypothetical protein
MEPVVPKEPVAPTVPFAPTEPVRPMEPVFVISLPKLKPETFNTILL